MTEENTPVESTAPAAPAPEPASGSESPPPSAEVQNINLDAKVQVDGSEVTVGQLIDVARHAVELNEYNQHASTLMKHDSDDAAKENAVRYLMGQEGYETEQINEYLQTIQGVGGTEETPQQEGQQEMNDPRVQENQQRLQQLEQSSRQMNVDFLRQNLNATVEEVMASNEKVQTLINRGRDLDPGNEADRLASIRRQVENQLVENVRSRKTKGESFNLNWFKEEGTKSADIVYDRVRSVIGDPNKIGRSPETASGEESFYVGQKPVDPPKFESGDNVGTVETKVREYNVDTLSRLATDLSNEGSKI